MEPSWPRAAFAEVDHLYGDFDSYVGEGLRLDAETAETLRAKPLTG
ncbi:MULTISPECIES: tyrosine-protein phosphatase [Streptomyces]|uniref:Tyrosine-protein phosphatase n=1 Tax=Streptomyces lienomycini TaxID=284035 RepID=A0ABV9X726_9ACTN|nr:MULTISPECIES: tyrosine-protein phosphatase [Streptomyces]